jgi:hypothetical protein
MGRSRKGARDEPCERGGVFVFSGFPWWMVGLRGAVYPGFQDRAGDAIRCGFSGSGRLASQP